MNPAPHLSAGLDAALADPDPAHLTRWLHAAPRGPSTYLQVDRSWGLESWLPLHHVADRGLHRAVGTLLDAGAQPDARTRFNNPLHARQTALHLAAAGGHTTVLAALLARGAEVEVRDARGRTPLWEAARRSHHRAVEALLHAGANPDPRDAAGRTPLHAVLMPTPTAHDSAGPAGSDADSTPDLLVDPGFTRPAVVIAQLLDAGADPNARCPREPAAYTPWLRATALGPAGAALAQQLLAAGAQPILSAPARED